MMPALIDAMSGVWTRKRRAFHTGARRERGQLVRTPR